MIRFPRVFERTVFNGAPILGRSPRMACLLLVFERTIRTAMSASFPPAAAVEFAGPRCGGNVWTTVVHRSQQSAVAAGGLLMLRLFRGHGDVVLTGRFHLSRRRTGCGSAPAAIEADPGAIVVDDRRVVGIVNDGDVHVGYRAIVVGVATPPVAAEKADPGVTQAVLTPALQAAPTTPVARTPDWPIGCT